MNEATLAAVISTSISGIGVFISYLVARQQTQVLRQSANQEKNHFIWQNRQEIIQPALNIVAPIFAVATLDLPASASDALANSWENYFRGFLMSPFKIRSWDTFYIIVNEYLQTLKRFKAGKITREVASKARYSSYKKIQNLDLIGLKELAP